jgi:N-acetylglutamate synthase-like GNAT family acetyltransferase
MASQQYAVTQDSAEDGIGTRLVGSLRKDTHQREMSTAFDLISSVRSFRANGDVH